MCVPAQRKYNLKIYFLLEIQTENIAVPTKDTVEIFLQLSNFVNKVSMHCLTMILSLKVVLNDMHF